MDLQSGRGVASSTSPSPSPRVAATGSRALMLSNFGRTLNWSRIRRAAHLRHTNLSINYTRSDCLDLSVFGVSGGWVN